MTLLPGALPGARWVWPALQLDHLEPHLGRGGEAGAQYLKHTTGLCPCPRHFSSGWRPRENLFQDLIDNTSLSKKLVILLMIVYCNFKSHDDDGYSALLSNFFHRQSQRGMLALSSTTTSSSRLGTGILSNIQSRKSI